MSDKSIKGHKSIFLVGMMGAGKSSFGKYLGRELNSQFVDLDEEIERRSGVSIPEIFEKEGETGFRIRETLLLKEFSRSENLVIATGGGVVTIKENREILKNDAAHVIHLQVSPKVCFFRTRNSNRPLLQTEDPFKTIETLIEKRTPLYEEVQKMAFDTEKMSFSQMSKAVLEVLEKEENNDNH